MRFTLRRATACDGDAIANVYSASFGLLTFLPMLHTLEEYRWFIANVILKEFEVTVAEDETGIVAFLARRGKEVRLLYTRPDRIGMGAGSQLIEASKATGVGALELWCFQANERARRFYEARGFHAIRFTDGADNEEQMPDIQYGGYDPPWSQIFLARHCRGCFKGHPGHNAPTKGELLVHGRDDEIRSHEPYE